MLNILKSQLSLKTQVYGLIILISVFSFTFHVFNNLEITRQYLQNQMGSHAQDTATSLGLSISPYLDKSNLIIAETMASAIFDSGYYKNITLTDTEGKILFRLENSTNVQNVPSWFINAFSLHAPTMSSELNNGWIIAANLDVTNHTGESYFTFWQNTKQSLYNSLVLLFGSLIAAFFILQAVFKPLKKVEQQAQQVTQKRFSINKNIPAARELYTVTNAINNMVMNLQGTFDTLTKQTETLTQQVYSDSLTGLGNRNSFNNYFKSIVNSISTETPHSALMLTLPSLAHINKMISYQDGDKHIKVVADLIEKAFCELHNTKIFRLNGSTFCILAPYETQFLKPTCIELHYTFNRLKNELHTCGFANLAITEIFKNSAISDILSALDTQCAFAEQFNLPVTKNADTHFSVNQWRCIINEIINSGEVLFSVQAAKFTHSQSANIYLEVFALFNKDNKRINNSHLFAMADKLSLTEELDKKLIRDFINIKEQYPNCVFAINLSSASLYSKSFIQWLTVFSLAKPILKTNLVFELHESSLLRDVNLASQHIDIIKSIGINICIEHFGVSLTSFKYLQGLNIEFIKIDGSYIQDVVENTKSQFFIQTVNSICHGFGIKVLACLIEDFDTMQTLESLGCDGLQGNYIMPPSSIVVSETQPFYKSFTLCTKKSIFQNQTKKGRT